MSHVAFKVGNYFAHYTSCISTWVCSPFYSHYKGAERTGLHMYSKEQYKSEQQPGDQLLGGSTALCCSSGASREKRKKLSERETFNAVEKKKVKRERERMGKQNKSGLQLYAESWSGKTEQIMVARNKILLINRNREERDIKTQRLMQKKAA